MANIRRPRRVTPDQCRALFGHDATEIIFRDCYERKSAFFRVGHSTFEMVGEDEK